MPTESSQNPNDERVSLHMQLLKEASAGRLDDIECPKCRQPAVSVWFTHPAADFYRTWFICVNCDFHTRAQNTQKPVFFSEDRASTELEEKDLAILRQSIFKRPPQRLM
jgi:hypothetical protein